MKRAITLIAALALGTAAFAQEAESPPPPSPKEVLEAAPADAWQEIAPVDLLVFQLAPAPDGSERRIVIQLMDAPWSQKWVRNMRQLAQGGWWDTNSSVYRIAPGFVAQWGDPNEDRAPMEGLEEVGRADFIHPLSEPVSLPNPCEDRVFDNAFCDAYAPVAMFKGGWPIATDGTADWPLHCPGMVGVARDVDPATGRGDTLYTIIGLIAALYCLWAIGEAAAVLAAQVEGLDLLRTQPPGTGEMGFYAEGQDPLTIAWARVASDLAPDARPQYKYLKTESDTFAQWQTALIQPNPFYSEPPSDYDICALTYPVRQVKGE